MKKIIKYAYCCGTDFSCELGETNAELFMSVESLKLHRKCAPYCGIVRVKITVDKVMLKGKGKGKGKGKDQR